MKPDQLEDQDVLLDIMLIQMLVLNAQQENTVGQSQISLLLEQMTAGSELVMLAMSVSSAPLTPNPPEKLTPSPLDPMNS